jgi:uncharacterized protein (DUF305 family)
MFRWASVRSAAVILSLLSLTGVSLQAQSSERLPQQAQGCSAMWGNRMGPSDQNFITMMIPHHEGAIAMADLALTRSKRPEIVQLARSIKSSQTRENAEMLRLYRQWYGSDLPQWDTAMGWGWRHGGMMGSGLMPGRSARGDWSGTNLEVLRRAADFDRAFLEQMIPHHQMGVMMASMEFNTTTRPEMRRLSEQMIRVQNQEIATMQAWYRQWYR